MEKITKIELGKEYHCLKTMYNSEDIIMYKKGNIYASSKDNILPDLTGNYTYEWIGEGYNWMGLFNQHFIEV